MPNTVSRAPRLIGRWLEPELFQPFIFGIFVCLSLSEFVRGALTLSLLPTYGRSVLHFAVEWTALALSLHYLVDNLLRTPSGWLVDRIGERSVLLIGFCISTASVFWMMHAHTVVMLILSLCGFGVGANAVWPTAMAGIGHSTPETKRASFMSYLYIFWLLGAGLGPVVINFLVGGTYRPAFWFLFGVDAMGFVAAFVLVRERTIVRGRASDGGASHSGATDGGASHSGATDGGAAEGGVADGGRATDGKRVRGRNSWGRQRVSARSTMDSNPVGGWKRIGGQSAINRRPVGGRSSGRDGNNLGRDAFGIEVALEPGLVRLDAVAHIYPRRRKAANWSEMWQNIKEVSFLFPGMFAQTFAVASLIPILSVYANAVLHLSGAMYSMVLVSGGAITVMGLIPTGKLVDRVGPRAPLVIAFLAAGLGLAVFPFLRTLPFTFGLVCLFGASYSFILPAWNAVLDKSIDEDKKGALWGVFMTVEGFGSAAGPYIGGLMWDRIGTFAPFWVSAGVIILMGLLYMVLPIERGYRTRAVRTS
ncbi:MFS transporter [Alicyclobacillus curvatus]|nr:MFS transporter [Alicyclobacillus curvatus]